MGGGIFGNTMKIAMHSKCAKLIHIVCYLLGVIHVAISLSVFVGGPERFPAPNYSVLLSAMRGTVWPYGVLWLTAGLLIIVGESQWRQIGLLCGIFIANLWATLFFIPTLFSDVAAYTPIAAYGGYGMMDALMIVLIRINDATHLEQE